MVINLLGTQYGFYYYYKQLSETPFYLTLFVPDCPLYTFFMALILILYLLEYEIPSLVANITFVGLIKYGIWTEFVFSIFPKYFFSDSLHNQTMILLFFHIGMILQSILLIPFISKSKKIFFFTLFWFLLNDFFDYIIGTIPYLPSPALNSILAFESVFVSVLFSCFTYRLAQSRTY